MNTLLRRKRREDRLGESPACLFCGREEPVVLTEAQFSLIEHHHVVRKVNDPEFTAPLCLICHRLVHEGIRPTGLNRGEPKTELHRIRNVLVIEGRLFQQLGERREELGLVLDKLIQNLPEGWKEEIDDVIERP